MNVMFLDTLLHVIYNQMNVYYSLNVYWMQLINNLCFLALDPLFSLP